MHCSKCGSDNPAGKKFCGDCGAPLTNCCSKCGAENPPGKRFCGDCGNALAAGNIGIPSRASASIEQAVRVTADQRDTSATADGERKTVTALFSDIKGSMELIEDLDPEEAQAIIDPALKLMVDAVHHYDGYVVQSTGDGIFALFGAPVAHEDHPQRALYAAMRMQEDIRRYGDRMRAQGQAPLQVRIGANTGEVVVRSLQTGAAQTEYTPVGHSTGLAARLQSLASPGSTVISGDTRRFVEGFFQLKHLGPTTIKGVSEPVELFEVIGLGPLRTRLQRAAWRGLTKFVGRERDIEALRHAADLARNGHGQLVGVMAEPGVGKSRLFHEFKLLSQSEWMTLEAFSVSHGKASSYLPVIELLKNYFEIGPGDDERKRRERVNGKILTLDRSLEDTLPYLFTLLSLNSGEDPLAQMDAQIKRHRTYEAVKRILLRESLDRPLMLIFEDLHWIDGETQGLLNVLVDSIANVRILLLVNYRPEYRHEWGNRTYYLQLRLDPLGRESADAMLLSLLGDEDELAPLRRLISDKTEGNPFFIEEIVQALFEDGSLVRNGRLTLTRSLTQVRVPTTVQAVLASRIDRLAVKEKELLQTLAVLGREFPLGLVQHALPMPADELKQLLSHLQLSEFVYEQPAFPEVEYFFKHALTQEVAYNSLLSGRRKLLHERAGTAMEALYADRLDDHLNELARHYERSGNAQKAVEYLQRAGQQSVSRASHAEAIALFTSALELLKTLPETPERPKKELALQLGLGSALQAIKGWSVPEVGQVFERARQLCQGLDVSHELFEALAGLIGFYFVNIQLSKAYELAQQLVSIAENEQAPDWLLKAHQLIGMTLAVMGEFPSAHAHLVRANSVHLSVRRSFYGAAALSWEAITLVHLGYPERALGAGEQALVFGREASDPLAYVNALNNVWYVRQLHQKGEAGLELAEEILSFAVEHGFQWYGAFAKLLRGQALIRLNRAEEAIGEISDAVAGMGSLGYTDSSLFYAALAEGLFRAGHTTEGLAHIAKGLEGSRKNHDGQHIAELWRLRGELVLQKAEPDSENQAEACFREAIEIARHQQAKWWELRATMSLARLLAQQNRRDEARTTLTDIYNWFTEGFGTADLKDAKALLDELSC